MNDRTQDLLVEIARLLRRFGPEPFEQLAREISDPESVASLERLLAGAARAARESRQLQTGKHDALAALKESQPEKFTLLTDVRRRLIEKRALPRLADVKAFAEKNNLPASKCRSRERAIADLVRALVELPLDRIKETVQRLPSTTEARSDLQGWSDLIMERRPERK